MANIQATQLKMITTDQMALLSSLAPADYLRYLTLWRASLEIDHPELMRNSTGWHRWICDEIARLKAVAE